MLNPDQIQNGNLSGSPRASQIRQQVYDPANPTAWVQEFEKPMFDKKPKITEKHDTAAYQSNFVIDMTALDYNTNSTPGAITYTASVAGAPGDFNWATDVQDTHVTAGRYTGTWSAAAGSSYVYAEGASNVLATDTFKRVYDPSQNTQAAWSSYNRLATYLGGTADGNWVFTGRVGSYSSAYQSNGWTITSPSGYWLEDGTWTAGVAMPGGNFNCNTTDLSCPSWQGWQ